MILKSLMSKFSLYAYIALFAIIAALFVHNKSLRNDNAALTLQIETYENKIEMLKEKSDIHAEKIELAHENASFEIKKDIEESEEILSSTVDKSCEGAMAWGINQAIIL